MLDLYIAPVGTSGIRQKRDSIVLMQDYGVIDDKFAGNEKKIDRSVMIVGLKPYKMAQEAEIELPQAALGENILLDFDPHSLDIGSRLSIGEAVIEITAACTLCNHLIKFSKDLPKLILRHRGIYCKVLKSGTISKEDKVILKD